MNPVQLLWAVILAGVFAIIGTMAFQRIGQQANKALGAI